MNIVQNHSSRPYEVMSGHYSLQFTWKVDQKCNWIKLRSDKTLLKSLVQPVGSHIES